MIYTDPEYPVILSDGEDANLTDEMLDYGDRLRSVGRFIEGQALQSAETATNVRVRNGKKIIVDGPFVETKELLTGFILIETQDLDTAIKVASDVPAAKFGVVEIRPIRELSRQKSQPPFRIPNQPG
jgi:hypothetical protein